MKDTWPPFWSSSALGPVKSKGLTAGEGGAGEAACGDGVPWDGQRRDRPLSRSRRLQPPHQAPVSAERGCCAVRVAPREALPGGGLAPVL